MKATSSNHKDRSETVTAKRSKDYNIQTVTVFADIDLSIDPWASKMITPWFGLGVRADAERSGALSLGDKDAPVKGLLFFWKHWNERVTEDE